MFSEASVLMVWAYQIRQKRLHREQQQLQAPLMSSPPPPEAVPTSPFLLMLPTIGDLLGTSLAGVGLLYV